MYLDAFLIVYAFKLFSQSLYMGNHHVNVFVVIVMAGPIVVAVVWSFGGLLSWVNCFVAFAGNFVAIC